MPNAAFYLRSSKDRSDVSLAAQRHELEKLAASRSLTVVRIFEDAVESGASDDRPGFLELARAIRDPARGWQYLYVYDTSRIARRRHIAHAFKHEAKKRGVEILYSKIPADLDPISEIVLQSVFEAMDEVHSLMSREKGLAGMAENVRRGWRAGGRAPIGYDLQPITTGTMREGRPVMKSKLTPSAHASAVRVYLKARASGTPRSIARAESSIGRSETTLVFVEWNALTYAGHTVWNRYASQDAGRKFRPRAQWHITRDTHPALISDTEAEAILAQCETNSRAMSVSRAMAARSRFLLTGLLTTSDGRMWVGHGDRYRLRAAGGQPGRTVAAALIDEAVLRQFQDDMTSEDFLKGFLGAVKKIRSGNPAASLDAQIRKLEREKARAADLALTTDESATFLTLVSRRATEIAALRREADALRADDALAESVARMTPDDLRALLVERGVAEALESLVETVTLDPDLRCRIDYKAIPGRQRWLGVASPRGAETLPPELMSLVRLVAA